MFENFSWTKILAVANTIVFFWMWKVGGDFFSPSIEILVQFGAKDVYLIAMGEYWRLLTPIFVHVGFLHFILNLLALLEIGKQIEKSIGGVWFLGIYFFAGIFGNIASAVFSLSTSAGASGAIFGILGVGFVLERTYERVARKYSAVKRPSPYTMMVLLNVILGFFIPGIDNAAHVGGLVVGVVVTFIMLRVKQNRLMKKNFWGASLAVLVFSVVVMLFTSLAVSKKFAAERYAFALELIPQDSKLYESYLEKTFNLSKAVAEEDEFDP